MFELQEAVRYARKQHSDARSDARSSKTDGRIAPVGYVFGVYLSRKDQIHHVSTFLTAQSEVPQNDGSSTACSLNIK